MTLGVDGSGQTRTGRWRAAQQGYFGPGSTSCTTLCEKKLKDAHSWKQRTSPTPLVNTSPAIQEEKRGAESSDAALVEQVLSLCFELMRRREQALS